MLLWQEAGGCQGRHSRETSREKDFNGLLSLQSGSLRLTASKPLPTQRPDGSGFGMETKEEDLHVCMVVVDEGIWGKRLRPSKLKFSGSRTPGHGQP